MSNPPFPSQRQVIFEFVVSGQFGQISAIDVATGLEVAAVVPAMTAKIDREALAFKKLAKALAEADVVISPDGPQPNEQASIRPPHQKRGLIV
jgi:hypothetical protein